MPEAKVTLCVPVYNSEKTLTETLESLVAQDYPLYKIKIFDNASTDSSLEICRRFSSRYPFIEVYSQDVNIGAEANFTRCLSSVEGDYCAIVHGDDVYQSNFISTSVKVLETSPDCVATFCHAFEIDGDGQIINERFLPPELRQKEVTFLSRNELMTLIFKYSNFITCPAVVVRSRAYSEHIKCWKGEQYKTSADLDVWLRLSLLGKIAAIRAPLMKYRVAPGSYSFRVAKKRTTKHDLFLVLDSYKTPKNSDDYTFLELKDQALRSLNIIRNRKREEPFPEDVQFNLSLLIKKMLHSKWHFKMGIAIMGIKALVTCLKAFRWSSACKK